ncbi:hypothetical protein BGW80DRAFT_1446761 [Lactifluus volemus]|nr:hypothetical protein BGW80DRAFT_1446761 [Lactifluus volemus]
MPPLCFKLKTVVLIVLDTRGTKYRAYDKANTQCGSWGLHLPAGANAWRSGGPQGQELDLVEVSVEFILRSLGKLNVRGSTVSPTDTESSLVIGTTLNQLRRVNSCRDVILQLFNSDARPGTELGLGGGTPISHCTAFATDRHRSPCSRARQCGWPKRHKHEACARGPLAGQSWVLASALDPCNDGLNPSSSVGVHEKVGSPIAGMGRWKTGITAKKGKVLGNGKDAFGFATRDSPHGPMQLTSKVIIIIATSIGSHPNRRTLKFVKGESGKTVPEYSKRKDGTPKKEDCHHFWPFDMEVAIIWRGGEVGTSAVADVEVTRASESRTGGQRGFRAGASAGSRQMKRLPV